MHLSPRESLAETPLCEVAASGADVFTNGSRSAKPSKRLSRFSLLLRQALLACGLASCRTAARAVVFAETGWVPPSAAKVTDIEERALCLSSVRGPVGRNAGTARFWFGRLAARSPYRLFTVDTEEGWLHARKICVVTAGMPKCDCVSA